MYWSQSLRHCCWLRWHFWEGKLKIHPFEALICCRLCFICSWKIICRSCSPCSLCSDAGCLWMNGFSTLEKTTYLWYHPGGLLSSICCWMAFLAGGSFIGFLHPYRHFVTITLNLLKTFFSSHPLINTFLWSLWWERICLMSLWIWLGFGSFCRWVLFMFGTPMEFLHAAFRMPWFLSTRCRSLLSKYFSSMPKETCRVDFLHCISISLVNFFINLYITCAFLRIRNLRLLHCRRSWICWPVLNRDGGTFCHPFK